MSTQLPKTVPVLKAKDICKFAYDGPNGTHCLAGWARALVGSDDILDGRVSRLCCAVRNIIDDFSIFDFNDDNPTLVVAATWNKAMPALGYQRRGDKFVMTGVGAGGEGKRGRQQQS
jgi:hypothetical protein